MLNWRFVDSEEAGAVWIQHPAEVSVFVDFQRPGGPWRRLLVVTRAWVMKQLELLQGVPANSPARVILSTALVLPDASGATLRHSLERALADPAVDHFAEILQES
jgi:hypothetical protein